MAKVAVEKDGATTIVSIDRFAEARNAVDPETAGLLREAFFAFDRDETQSVAILTGRGGTFCAGYDLKVAASRGSRPAFNPEAPGPMGPTRHLLSKPVIAAVDGPALAGGTEIVLASDLVVASTTATFGIPEVKRSLVAGAGGLFRLGRKIPLNIAMELTLTGDPIDATRAHHFGLVNRLVEPGQALEEAISLAEQICANAPVAVRESRKIVIEATNAPDEIGWKMSMEGMAVAMRSEDFSEGLTAFIEKRPPAWKGR